MSSATQGMPTAPPTDPRHDGQHSPATLMLSPADVARELGISTRTVRRLDLEGRLPAPVRIGRAVRWPRETLVAWIAAGAPRRDEWEAARDGL